MFCSPWTCAGVHIAGHSIRAALDQSCDIAGDWGTAVSPKMCKERAEVLCDQSGPPGATEQVCLVPASASPGQDSYFEPSDAIRYVAHPSECCAYAPALMSRHLAKCPARQIEAGITGMSKRLRSNGFLCI